MKVYIVCSNDVDERYGCYIDSVWAKRKKAENRQEELAASRPYEECWTIKKFKVGEKGDY